MSIKDLIQSHEIENRVLGNMKVTIQQYGKDKIYFSDIRGERVKAEDIYMGIISLLKATQESTKADYQQLAAESILKIITEDPHYNKNSVKEMIEILQDWNKRNTDKY